MSTLVGMQLSGRYRLDAQIGAGGMSTVYRAFDVNLERRVAIKLLHREMSADSDQLERFRREARAVAQLSHPHIVGVIDAGEDENRPYIVFEYVEGETLKDRIRRLGRLPVDESLAYAIEIARALGCAHAHEIVHRDVKPQNVLLDPEGSAKVTDFGIARSLRDDGLTADGRVLGTTDYVSPEQALGHDVDGQSDIYSLGVVLYEMLTGDVPFHGENQISVAMKHVREDLPDVQRIRPEVSATTAAVLDRMTDKDLAHRYADVPSLVADLEDALALEAARQGTSTGEATAVIRTLPARARRRLPFRMRHSLPVLGVIGADRRRRGDRRDRRRARSRRASRRAPAPAGSSSRRPRARKVVSVRRALRPRLRPARRRRGAQRRGLPHRRPRRRHGLVDRALPATASRARARPASASTSTPSPRSRPSRCRSRRPSRAGRRRSTPPRRARRPKSVPEGWTKVGGGTVNSKDKRFKLDTGGTAYRYYLVWITKLAPDAESAEISEIRLFQEVARVESAGYGARAASRAQNATERSSAKRSSASASSRSQSAGNGRPDASQSFG